MASEFDPRFLERKPSTDLRLYLPFNRGDASDAGLYSHSVSLSGDASVGTLGRFLSLDGAGDYATITRSSSLDNIVSVTYSFWIYPATMPTATNLKRVFTKASTNSNGATIWIGDISGTFDNAIELNIQGAGTLSSWYANTSIAAATWQHVVITWNGSNSAGSVVIYVNGQAKTTVQRQSTLSTFDDSSNNILLGIRSVLLDNALDGSLADFRIYSRILAAGEISVLYSQGRP